ncbi:sigma-70 family RNA polymerase sigma factor [Bacillus paralicheniformis]|nr:sigma-70 family RNA polymerase sigma factor [Bacillus paralicheniformis]
MKKMIKGRMLTRDEAVIENMPLVVSIAEKKVTQLRYTSLEIPDLISAGSVGLMKAFDSYDPEAGASFSSYAYFKIDAEINYEIMKNGYSTVHFPLGIKRLARKIAVQKLSDLPVEEIAKTLNEKLENVHYAKLCLVEQKEYLSLNEQLSTEEKDFREILGYTPDSNLILNDFVSRLQKTDREIIMMKLSGASNEAIGKRIGCTGNNIKHRLNKIREQHFAYMNGHRVNVPMGS